MAIKRIFACCICLTLTALIAKAQHSIKGKATYYSDKLHGRKTSNGERYHRDSMTCAHKKFPFGTLLRVRNTLNDREVVVRVTDRGPYAKRYIIDLSKAAARQLNFLKRGVCPVEITPISPDNIPFRAENGEIIPKLNLQFQDMTMYPVPIWRQQQILQEKKPDPTEIKNIDNKKQ